MENHIFYFLKFGNKENMTDLISNGTIYFNTIEYFRVLEEQKTRGDLYEGTINILNFKEKDNYTLTIGESREEIKLKITKAHLREFQKNIKGNLYSLYTLKSPDILKHDFRIDAKNKEFGSHVVIIKHADKFLKMICKELDKKKISYSAKLVSYYEKEKISGEITLFDKCQEYDYQKEFRIILFTNSTTPIKIQIGNIENIAEIFETSNIEKAKFDYIEKKTV